MFPIHDSYAVCFCNELEVFSKVQLLNRSPDIYLSEVKEFLAIYHFISWQTCSCMYREEVRTNTYEKDIIAVRRTCLKI